MVAAEALALAEKRESAARAKAAAWAWYQRSGGSAAPTAGRSEAFATRCAARQSASRFHREAAAMAASSASTASDSALTSCSSMGNSSSLSHEYSTSFGDGTDPDHEDLSSSSDQISDPDTACPEYSISDQENGLALQLALHPSACWDCGSTLFDSFELVAMSKKLDTELQNLNIDSGLASQNDCSTVSSSICGNGELHQQHAVPSLCDKLCSAGSPPSPHLFHSDEADDDDDDDEVFDTPDKLVSPPDVLSKQEIYDMFCQYGDASYKLHATKSMGKESAAEPLTGADEFRKQKVRSQRMPLHVLAKALHSLRHRRSKLDGAKVRDLHHPPYSPHHRKGGLKSLSLHGYGSHAGAFWVPRDEAADKHQHQKARHIHHHHHHHYHYLFHSDDDFSLQPLDKSLMVAAAGLRSSPKLNPTLVSYRESPGRGDFSADYGRKWADLGTISASLDRSTIP